MKKVYIQDKKAAEYYIRFHGREMEHIRQYIAKEESKEKPNEKKLALLDRMYNKSFNYFIQSKVYLSEFE